MGNRYTTRFQDAQFYAVFVCGLSMKSAENLIHKSFDLPLISMWADMGAAVSDDGFEALNRWQRRNNFINGVNPKTGLLKDEQP